MFSRWIGLGCRAHWLAVAGVSVLMVAVAAWPAAQALRPVRAVAVSAVLPGPGRAAVARGGAPGGGRTVQAPGWVEPEPFATAVAALADGVVARVTVLEGESVEAGQVVAELVREDAEFAADRAQAFLAAAQARVVGAAAALAAAQTRWDQPVERERRIGVAAARRAEAAAALARHPARVRAGEAELARWRQELELLDGARDRGAATERERVVAGYRVQALAAELDALRAEAAELQARLDRHVAEADAAVRDAALRVRERRELDQARAELARCEAEVSRARAARDEAALQLERMTVRAPVSGNVLRRQKGPGDKVVRAMDDPHSSHVVHLYDPARLQVRVDVPLADAAQVGVGQVCEVVVDVLPDATFRGEVIRVTHEADLQKNTLEIQVRVVDPSPWLKPEMLARVKFLGVPGSGTGGEPAAAGADPDRAPLRVDEACLDLEGSRVWVVRDRRGPRGAAVPVPVRVTARDQGVAVVQAPLHVGDLLIRRPRGLAAGDQVRVTPGAAAGSRFEDGGDA